MSIIDTALETVAGTVAKDLEPAAVAALEDLKALVHERADRLRTALPLVEQKALAHVRSISDAVLAEYDGLVARIDSHLAGATPTPAAGGSAAVGPSTSSATEGASSDPTQAPTGAPVTPTGSSSSSTPPSTDSASATTETTGA